MQSRDKLPDRVGDILSSVGKDTEFKVGGIGNLRVSDILSSVRKDMEWLADRLTVSVETVRDWDAGKQPIPENKRKILEAFVVKQGGITISEDDSRTPKPPKDIINLT